MASLTPVTFGNPCVARSANAWVRWRVVHTRSKTVASQGGPSGVQLEGRPINIQMQIKESHMLHRSIYRTLVKTAVLAGFVSAAMFGANIAQARPAFVQDVQFAPTVVAPPHLGAQVVVVQPPHRPVVVRRHRIVRPPIVVVPGPVYRDGRRHYRRHGHYRPYVRHYNRRDGRHDQGRHLGQNR